MADFIEIQGTGINLDQVREYRLYDVGQYRVDADFLLPKAYREETTDEDDFLRGWTNTVPVAHLEYANGSVKALYDEAAKTFVTLMEERLVRWAQ